MRGNLLTLTDANVAAARTRSREYALRDTACPGLALRIQPSGARTWVFRSKANGSRRITLGAASDLSVDQARALATRQAATTGHPPAPAAPTFNQLADRFLAAKAGVYTPRTIVSLNAYLNPQLRPALGSTPIDRLTTPQIAAWFHAYSRKMPGGANIALGHLVTMLRFARDHGLLPREAPNPCAPIRRNRRPPRGRLLSREQIRALGRVLDRVPPWGWDAADAIRLVLLTGCRSGEILRLRRDEVQPDRLALTRTKTGPRDVLLNPAAIALLNRRRTEATTAFVFPHPRQPDRPVADIARHWHSFRDAAGLPSDIRLHDLRHTFASHAVMSGETIAMAGKLLGHRRIATTERYAHLDGEHVARAAARVEADVWGMMGEADDGSALRMR